MTATEFAANIPTPTPSVWDIEFANLKTRFPKAKTSIVFCVHALQQNPGASTGDLKALAGLHGIRVTAASITAAQRLLAPATVASAPGSVAAATPTSAAAPVARRERAISPAADAETMIRGIVAKLQSQSTADAQRLRDAIRKAITVLQAAVG